MQRAELNALTERIKNESSFADQLITEISKVIVGQKYMIERLVIGLLCNGHILLEGVPGLAKTTSVQSLAAAISTTFNRIQFTPDLLPADLIGTLIYNPQKSDFYVKRGPIFANIILADEINRAPAKVQSALLEAMQERQVTIGDKTFKLEDPFLVLATQNPIDQEGTYALPEAQVDRFMFKLYLDYPNRQEELEILRKSSQSGDKNIVPVIQPERIIQLRTVVRQIYMDSKIENYIVDLVCASRNPAKYGLVDHADLIEYGASPRATISLAIASKAHAFMKHRGYVTPEDVHAVGKDVLRHRIIVSYQAEAREIDSEKIIQTIFQTVEIP
ncbi:ATPase [Candidatus Poribacteria bacterium]|jgi:MoxR-like ATPase|nr:ATPase [Candidatus Poribacteria bacterium]MEE2911109.1 MoxR family ATPase [Candidatus Poribacteria bacterium]|tara:strand:- start:973 stop:1965 length:993 start_codon:yes stop_codon:yes gene_type:complete